MPPYENNSIYYPKRVQTNIQEQRDATHHLCIADDSVINPV